MPSEGSDDLVAGDIRIEEERGKERERKGRTSRTNSRYPIHKTHMNRYDIIRSIRRWFSMRRKGRCVE
jgi:hypothetical protein